MDEINKALVVPFEDIRNGITRARSRVMSKIHPLRYGLACYGNLCKLDERFLLISEDFKEKVFLKALGIEILSKNLHTVDSSKLCYPKQEDISKGIRYFYSAVKEEIGSLNPVEAQLLISLILKTES
ncbi:hypothetical protein BDW_06220 [Bdellovibrio bacteriovorus W]|nr:hypothetical protein BDW_06220 [Bdellovibrio bacteriovorus W]